MGKKKKAGRKGKVGKQLQRAIKDLRAAEKDLAKVRKKLREFLDHPVAHGQSFQSVHQKR
jgi:hypothetical protein